MNRHVLVRYAASDNSLHTTRLGAADKSYAVARQDFLKQFENRNTSIHGDPDAVDKTLDRLFAELRTLRGLNHQRRIAAQTPLTPNTPNT